MGTTARRVTRNTAVQALGKALSIPLAIVMMGLLTRHLLPDGFGSLKTALAHLFIFGILTDLGLSGIAVREMAREPARAGSVLRAVLRLRLVLSMAAVLLTAGTAFLLPYTPLVRKAILIGSLSFPVHAAIGAHGALLQAKLAMGWSVLADLAGRVAGVLLVVAVIALGGGVLECVAAGLAAALIQFACVRAAVGGRLPAEAGPEVSWGPLVRSALPFGCAALLVTVLLKIDLVMLGVLRGAHDAGIYGLAQSLVEGVLALAGFFVMSVYSLLSAPESAVGSRFLATLARSSQVLLGFGLASAAGLFFLGPLAARLLGGAAFLDASGPLLWLALSLPFSSVAMLWGYALVARKREKDLLLLAAAVAGLNVGANFLVIPAYGAAGAACVTLACEVLGALLGAWFLRRLLGCLPFRAPLLHEDAARGLSVVRTDCSGVPV